MIFLAHHGLNEYPYFQHCPPWDWLGFLISATPGRSGTLGRGEGRSVDRNGPVHLHLHVGLCGEGCTHGNARN